MSKSNIVSPNPLKPSALPEVSATRPADRPEDVHPSTPIDDWIQRAIDGLTRMQWDPEFRKQISERGS